MIQKETMFRECDIAWFEANVPDSPSIQQRMGRRLDDAISHRDCVQLAEWSDLRLKQDQAKCEAIRNPDAEDERQTEALERSLDAWLIKFLGWLSAVLGVWAVVMTVMYIRGR